MYDMCEFLMTVKTCVLWVYTIRRYTRRVYFLIKLPEIELKECPLYDCLMTLYNIHHVILSLYVVYYTMPTKRRQRTEESAPLAPFFFRSVNINY